MYCIFDSYLLTMSSDRWWKEWWTGRTSSVEKMWLRHWGTAIHKRHSRPCGDIGQNGEQIVHRQWDPSDTRQRVGFLLPLFIWPTGWGCETWPRLKSPILLTWKIWIASKYRKSMEGQNQHLGAPKQALLQHESALFSFKNAVLWGALKTPHNPLIEYSLHTEKTNDTNTLCIRYCWRGIKY